MKVMVTGAAGPIGLRTAKLIQDERLGIDIEFLLATDREDKEPWFSNTSEQHWIKADLDEIDNEWWERTVEDYEIDYIIYVESNENLNVFIPTSEITSRLAVQDSKFISYLNGLFFPDGEPKLKVVYLSTDKMYNEDKFPNSLNTMKILQPEGNEEEVDPSLNYAAMKIGTELELTSLAHISLRIIRPFSIVSPEQDYTWPLTHAVLTALTGGDLSIFEDGRRGITYTHSSDLAKFLIANDLFNEEIAPNLTSRIIDFCRVWNYLPEDLLIRKIKAKCESTSEVLNLTTTDMFPQMMHPPQIRNMTKIQLPVMPIEEIIEELIYALDPIYHYEDLVVVDASYNPSEYIVVSGTVEPLATVVVQLGIGVTISTEATDDGSWAVLTDEPIFYDDVMEGTAFATSQEGIQYDTVTFEVQPVEV